jgi:hypothetical protein
MWWLERGPILSKRGRMKRWLSGGGTFFLSDGVRIDLLKNRPNSNSIRFAITAGAMHLTKGI